MGGASATHQHNAAADTSKNAAAAASKSWPAASGGFSGCGQAERKFGLTRARVNVVNINTNPSQRVAIKQELPGAQF